jgi:KipI family sensor histidine kinase inhibitor
VTSVFDSESPAEEPAVAHVASYGPEAFLLRATDPNDVPNLLAALDDQSADHPALREAHAGERSILVRIDPAAADAQHTPDMLRQLHPKPLTRTTDHHALPVSYDGADLASVAATTALPVQDVIALHTSATYRVAFCGFAPGFAYLTGLPEQLQLPRLDSPRPVVPQGSVAIAAHYCAVYPSQSPGGWLLLGTCQTQLFDPTATSPALLTAGTTVTFEAIQ